MAAVIANFALVVAHFLCSFLCLAFRLCCQMKSSNVVALAGAVLLFGFLLPGGSLRDFAWWVRAMSVFFAHVMCCSDFPFLLQDVAALVVEVLSRFSWSPVPLWLSSVAASSRGRLGGVL